MPRYFDGDPSRRFFDSTADREEYERAEAALLRSSKGEAADPATTPEVISPAAGEPGWTTRDDALLKTCETAVDLSRHIEPTFPEVLAPFPPAAPDRQFWVADEFELLDWRAAGDGSYVHKSGLYFGRGGLGLSFVAAATTATALGNRHRRKRAIKNTELRWTTIGQGEVYIAPSSMTMDAGSALYTWRHEDIQAAEMMSPGCFQFQGLSNAEPVKWVLVSTWAELIFVTWALHHHPRHPQLINGDWLPEGWLDYCAEMDVATRLKSPILSPGVVVPQRNGHLAQRRGSSGLASAAGGSQSHHGSGMTWVHGSSATRPGGCWPGWSRSTRRSAAGWWSGFVPHSHEPGGDHAGVVAAGPFQHRDEIPAARTGHTEHQLSYRVRGSYLGSGTRPYLQPAQRPRALRRVSQAGPGSNSWWPACAARLFAAERRSSRAVS